MSSISHIMDTNLDDLPVDRKSCQLLGPTALVVQALMGIFAILSLVYKRQREAPKRPWKIWLFDVSKQVAGQMFIHGLNVVISDLGSQQFSGNACTFYFLNILVDTTLGVGLIYLVLQATTYVLAKRFHLKGFQSGQYGNPPSFRFWTRQAAVYVFSLTTMKLLVILLFAVWPGIFGLGDWLLSWTRMGDGESFQVIFVMGIFPIIMNTLQFWLIDSIVKANGSQFNPPFAAARNSDAQDREPLFRDGGDDTLPHDVENVSRSGGSRMSSGMNTIVCPEDDLPKLLSAPPSPIVFTEAVPPTYDYPPNIGSPSSASSRSRQRPKWLPPPSFELGSGCAPPPISDFPRYPSPLLEEPQTCHAASEDRRDQQDQYLIGEK